MGRNRPRDPQPAAATSGSNDPPDVVADTVAAALAAADAAAYSTFGPFSDQDTMQQQSQQPPSRQRLPNGGGSSASPGNGQSSGPAPSAAPAAPSAAPSAAQLLQSQPQQTSAPPQGDQVGSGAMQGLGNPGIAARQIGSTAGEPREAAGTPHGDEAQQLQAGEQTAVSSPGAPQPASRQRQESTGSRNNYERLQRLFRDPQVVLRLNFQPLMDLDTAQQGGDSEKAMMRAIATINHFAMVNADLMDGVAGLKAFAANIGLTSSAKDVVAAQLLGKSELAVSGQEMTTAASEFMTALERSDGGQADHYEVHFRGRLEYNGEDASAFHAARARIMGGIRGGGINHTSDHVTVLVKSAMETWPAYILNTIGMMPRATAGEDTVYSDINALLNDQALSDGGILIICHDVQRPLDATAAHLDLDVIKEFKRNPAQSRFRIVVARTKADLLETVNFQRCTSFKDVYDIFFGQFEERLPGVDMFAVTGWRAEDPRDAAACASKFEQTMQEVKQRILDVRPEEMHSPWLAKLESRLGTRKFIKHYHSLVSAQGQDFLRTMSTCIAAGVRSMQAEVQRLHARKMALARSSLAGAIPEVCMMVEKIAVIVRLNSLERPSSSCVQLDSARNEASQHRQTLEQELQLLTQQYGNFLVSACQGNEQQVYQLLGQQGLEMNSEKHHAFWARMARLKDNARTFAKMYDMPRLTKEEINAWTKASTVRNTSDVEHFLFIYILDKIKSIFRDELVPLFSHWIAHYVHESYNLAFSLALQEEPCAALKGNVDFERIFSAVLHDVYHGDVCTLIMKRALDRQPAFLERVSVERERRLTIYADSESAHQWKQRCDDVQDAKFESFLKNLVPQNLWPSSPGSQPAADLSAYLNDNPAAVFNPRRFLKLEPDEIAYLNELGRYFFSNMLVQCIVFFFNEAETTLDFVYTENRWNVDQDFLFKKFYFRTKAEARLSNQRLLADHETKMQGLEPIQRYQGYDLKQLMEEDVVKFKPAIREDMCSLCGNPSSQQYCGSTGQPHGNPQGSANGPTKRDLGDPFKGIVEHSATLPDLTYGIPAADVPGYRARLHEDVVREAKLFLGQYFDDRASRVEAIEAEARPCAEKFHELQQLQIQLDAARRNLSSGMVP